VLLDEYFAFLKEVQPAVRENTEQTTSAKRFSLP
jgi:hypothetical protein